MNSDNKGLTQIILSAVQLEFIEGIYFRPPRKKNCTATQYSRKPLVAHISTLI